MSAAVEALPSGSPYPTSGYGEEAGAMSPSSGEGDGGFGTNEADRLRGPPPNVQVDENYLRDVPHLQQVSERPIFVRLRACPVCPAWDAAAKQAAIGRYRSSWLVNFAIWSVSLAEKAGRAPMQS